MATVSSSIVGGSGDAHEGSACHPEASNYVLNDTSRTSLSDLPVVVTSNGHSSDSAQHVPTKLRSIGSQGAFDGSQNSSTQKGAGNESEELPEDASKGVLNRLQNGLMTNGCNNVPRRPSSGVTMVTPDKRLCNEICSAVVQAGQYIFPPESAPHRATILAYPSAVSLPPDLLEPVRAEIAELSAAIACFEPVRLFVRPEDLEAASSQILRIADDPSHIELIPFAVNHCWVRDSGPVYVYSAGPDRFRYAINFGFDEWGGKAPGSAAPDGQGIEWGQEWPILSDTSLAENASFASRVIDADTPAAVRLNPQLTTEGGGLIVDGEGTLLITESCMICDVRNPGWSKSRIELELERLLGVEKIIWFPGCKNEDITDCHVDAVARFVRPGLVVMSRPHDSQPRVWIDVFEEAKVILERETDAKGRPFEIVVLYEPDIAPLIKMPDDEIVTSYVNFYHVNSGLIVPKFGDSELDKKAYEILKNLYPTRHVKQVFLNALPRAGGGIHCVTQQVPFSKIDDTWVERLQRRSMIAAAHMKTIQAS
ncbi:MAG: hypothetical protein Q9217_003727 [Psora testacea]